MALAELLERPSVADLDPFQELLGFRRIVGRLVHRDEAGVSPFDSAVHGGDAVWEGLRLYDGRIFKLHEHLDRLERSHRRWKLALRATMMLLLAGIGLGAAAPRSPPSIPEAPLVGSAVDEVAAP